LTDKDRDIQELKQLCRQLQAQIDKLNTSKSALMATNAQLSNLILGLKEQIYPAEKPGDEPPEDDEDVRALLEGRTDLDEMLARIAPGLAGKREAGEEESDLEDNVF
jgi:hypothetical protein